MNHFSVRIPILEVPKARRSQNDKFVTVGVPEAETNANLILFGFEIRFPISWTQKTKNFWGGG